MKVKGKFMARLRTEAEGWLAIRCDFVDREILLQAAPHVFHLTPHYENYPAVLVRLSRIKRDALEDLLRGAWRFVREKATHRAADPRRRRRSRQ